MDAIFSDRSYAGQLLAKQLIKYTNDSSALVLALPRGGVPVGYEISSALHIPLDIFLVRKIGAPFNEEFAIGAIALGDRKFINEALLTELNISEKSVNMILNREKTELMRRNEIYRQNRPFPDLHNRTIILVDDGIATGATMHAAIQAIKDMQPKKIVLAVPVAPPEVYKEFLEWVDEIICLETPAHFSSVGQWYQEFPQINDSEVLTLLNDSAKFTNE